MALAASARCITWEDIRDAYEETLLYDSRVPLCTHFMAATGELRPFRALTAGIAREGETLITHNHT